MTDLSPPFFAVDGKDVAVYETLDRMAAGAEAYDVGDNEFFDALGRPLIATVEGYRVRLDPDRQAPPSSARLERLLRDYFRGLPERLRSFKEAAGRAGSLDALVMLRWDLHVQHRGGLLRRFLRRGT